MTINEIIEKQNRPEFAMLKHYEDEIYEAIIEAGIENLKFMVRMETKECKKFDLRKYGSLVPEYRKYRNTVCKIESITKHLWTRKYVFVPLEPNDELVDSYCTLGDHIADDMYSNRVRIISEDDDRFIKKFFEIFNLTHEEKWTREYTLGYIFDYEENVKVMVEEINDKRKSKYIHMVDKIEDADFIQYREITVSSPKQIKAHERATNKK